MNERLWNILVDSFPKLLGYGIRVTVPLTVFSFAIALSVALLVALIQYANMKGCGRSAVSISGSPGARRSWSSCISCFSACPESESNWMPSSQPCW